MDTLFLSVLNQSAAAILRQPHGNACGIHHRIEKAAGSSHRSFRQLFYRMFV